MQSEIKVDLHCHSFYSDGTTSPESLLARALTNQITYLAITDHDCMAAFGEARPDAGDVTIIAGVEISCDWLGQEIHVVGLFVDRHNIELQTLLKNQQRSRRLRVEGMSEKLNSLGSPGLMDYLKSLPAIALTRSHVADFLVDKLICKTRKSAFKTHLGKRGMLYVAPQWASLEEAVGAITNAGGFSVLAHPSRYSLKNKKLNALASSFKAAGGTALEGSYPSIDPKTMNRLETLACEHSLMLSAGSDFHDPASHWTELGKFPKLDSSARAMALWHHPLWQQKVESGSTV
ncbi:MAG: putative metal-dependent phosphoesterase TrpH [Candidatus Azotimanducaceae bacterium]|jgi:predicted metal-dependent phosphoesterase TrpH